MVNFVICEDNKYVREMIEGIICKALMPYDFNYKVYSYEKYDIKMKNFIHTPSDIKVYILDLELPNKSGVDIASEIRKVDWDSIIIISTSHDELELKILKQKLLILDFISKFDDYEKRLCDTINMVIKNLKVKKILSFKSNKELHHIAFDNIIFIYHDPELEKTKIITYDDEYEVRESLVSIISRLDDRFYQSHRACYVNKNRIKTIDFKEGIIYFDKGKYTDYLSRNYKKGLRNYYVSK